MIVNKYGGNGGGGGSTATTYRIDKMTKEELASLYNELWVYANNETNYDPTKYKFLRLIDSHDGAFSVYEFVIARFDWGSGEKPLRFTAAIGSRYQDNDGIVNAEFDIYRDGRLSDIKKVNVRPTYKNLKIGGTTLDETQLQALLALLN